MTFERQNRNFIFIRNPFAFPFEINVNSIGDSFGNFEITRGCGLKIAWLGSNERDLEFSTIQMQFVIPHRVSRELLSKMKPKSSLADRKLDEKNRNRFQPKIGPHCKLDLLVYA